MQFKNEENRPPATWRTVLCVKYDSVSVTTLRSDTHTHKLIGEPSVIYFFFCLNKSITDFLVSKNARFKKKLHRTKCLKKIKWIKWRTHQTVRTLSDETGKWMKYDTDFFSCFQKKISLNRPIAQVIARPKRTNKTADLIFYQHAITLFVCLIVSAVQQWCLQPGNFSASQLS